MKYKVTYPNYPSETPTFYGVKDGVVRYDKSTPGLSSNFEFKDMVDLRCDGNGVLIEVEGENKCYLDYAQMEYLLIALLDRAKNGGTSVEYIEHKKIL